MTGVEGIGLRSPTERLAPAARWYWVVSGVIVSLVVLTAAAVVAVLLPDPPSAWSRLRPIVIVATLLFAVVESAIVPLWRYRVHRWEITPDAVYTSAGALRREWRIVPLSRIQTIEVGQGPLERLFGVARLKVKTASYVGSTDVEGLPAPVARDLAFRLSERLRHPTEDAT
ncbi:MAG: PH domain-containing protein [Acidimicrobiales bacterium]